MTGPRLRDVAQRACVSMTTASIVLRRLPGARISPATRARVQQAADELGYRPRQRHQELRFAAIVLEPDGSLDASRLLMATAEEASRAGRLVVVIPTGDDVLHADGVLDQDVAVQVDGLVRVDPSHGVAPPPLHLVEHTVVVFLAHPVDEDAGGATVVVPDDLGAAREVGKALAGAGHRRVAIVAGRAEARIADRWRDGLADGFAVTVDAIPVVDPASGVGHGAAAAGAAPELEDVVTALVCMSARSAEIWAGPGSERGINLAPGHVTLVRGGPLTLDGLADAVTWLPLPTSELARAALSAALEGPGARVHGVADEPAVVVVPFPVPPRLVVPAPVVGAAAT